MNAAQSRIPHGRRLSAYIVLLIAVWTLVMGARLLPQFNAALRIDGRITTVDDYIADRCGARLGPEATTCLATARRKAETQLRREQARSVLIIVAPAVLYSLYLALATLSGTSRRRASSRIKDTR
ncbi:MAG TPA: hypothetical protein VEU53_01785 [Stellaceae bacterium]|nr:hypothetical protein [Stellaceae bacterium]